MNRVGADIAKHFTAVDYGLALPAVAQYRRAVQSWWHDGWDLLLTPTLGELPLKLGTIVNDPDDPMSPGVSTRLPPNVRPAISTKQGKRCRTQH